jgi:hypothetical protein
MFPPIDTKSSTIMKLDIAPNNVSTILLHWTPSSQTLVRFWKYSVHMSKLRIIAEKFKARMSSNVSISALLVVAALTLCVLTYVKLRMQFGSMAGSGTIENKRNGLLLITTELPHLAKEEPSVTATRLRIVKMI